MDKIKALQKKAMDNGIPIMQDEGIVFILEHIKANNYCEILEIGTAVGYSAIRMALINSNIQVTTLEINEERFQEARSNIEDFKLQNQIELILVDALNYQPHKQYDLIFIDGAKAQYGKFLAHYMPSLKKEGVMIFDNLEFHGLVNDITLTTNRNTKQLVRKIKHFRDEILSDNTYSTRYYPNIGDGILEVRRKE